MDANTYTFPHADTRLHTFAQLCTNKNSLIHAHAHTKLRVARICIQSIIDNTLHIISYVTFSFFFYLHQLLYYSLPFCQSISLTSPTPSLSSDLNTSSDFSSCLTTSSAIATPCHFLLIFPSYPTYIPFFFLPQ